MNRERAKELLPIIQAFAEGKDIQNKYSNDRGWRAVEQPSFDDEILYRIKPEPEVLDNAD